MLQQFYDELFPFKMPENTLKIRWQDKIPNIKALKKAGMESVNHTLLKLGQLRWTGHVYKNA